MDTEGIILRTVLEEDVRDIWIWRNHPETRNRSFNSDEIPFADHLKWFAARIKDANSVIFIAEDRQGRKLGQARFDKQGREATISVGLNPDFFGKGIGSIFIAKATSEFLNKNREIKIVTAEIIEDKIASLKAFLKAGYEVAKEGVMKKSKRIKVLTYNR